MKNNVNDLVVVTYSNGSKAEVSLDPKDTAMFINNMLIPSIASGAITMYEIIPANK